jgi:alpha-D-ribose 1-methylphosphonate 5-phosphate C-P lyase
MIIDDEGARDYVCSDTDYCRERQSTSAKQS